MNLVFSDQAYPTEVVKSLFLAGPSPRVPEHPDWRQEAVALLERIGFSGTVFVPVPQRVFEKTGALAGQEYDTQIKWETTCRAMADQIVFWVPRDIAGGMPAFTTNTEFGEDLSSGKMVYGRPPEAEKCRYLDARYAELGEVPHTTLEGLLRDASARLGSGSIRKDGETKVPLFIWNSPQFQGWYADLKLAGNSLVDAKVLHSFKIKNKFLLSYVMWVNVWVAAENRYKSNEFVFSRKNISTIVAYRLTKDSVEVVLVKEFRSPVSTPEGYVYELPGGSSFETAENPLVTAQHELEEECGLHIDDVSRFKLAGTRQLVATLSTHKGSVYYIELTALEMDALRKKQRLGEINGVVEDTERTMVYILNLKNIADVPVDHSTLGMISLALATVRDPNR